MESNCHPGGVKELFYVISLSGVVVSTSASEVDCSKRTEALLSGSNRPGGLRLGVWRYGKTHVNTVACIEPSIFSLQR